MDCTVVRLPGTGWLCAPLCEIAGWAWRPEAAGAHPSDRVSIPQSALSALCGIPDAGFDAEPLAPCGAHQPPRALRSVRSTVPPLSPSRNCYGGWRMGGTSRPPPLSMASPSRAQACLKCVSTYPVL
eukprot:6195888-Pleurochrysis_carterae.AAC.2